MDFLYNLLPHLLNGLALGLLFALVALGFMLIIGVMEVINLAHGSLFALGAYVAFAVGMIVLLWLFLQRTRYGALIKAGAHDSEMVRALGVNLTRLRLLVFAFGTALAAVAGIVMAPIWGVRPHVGVDAVVPAFVIIVLGGVGSFWGAVIAGLLVGMVVGITGAFATAWSLVSMYVLLILVVTVRGRGLLGKKSVLER